MAHTPAAHKGLRGIHIERDVDVDGKYVDWRPSPLALPRTTRPVGYSPARLTPYVLAAADIQQPVPPVSPSRDAALTRVAQKRSDAPAILARSKHRADALEDVMHHASHVASRSAAAPRLMLTNGADGGPQYFAGTPLRRPAAEDVHDALSALAYNHQTVSTAPVAHTAVETVASASISPSPRAPPRRITEAAHALRLQMPLQPSWAHDATKWQCSHAATQAGRLTLTQQLQLLWPRYVWVQPTHARAHILLRVPSIKLRSLTAIAVANMLTHCPTSAMIALLRAHTPYPLLADAASRYADAPHATRAARLQLLAASAAREAASAPPTSHAGEVFMPPGAEAMTLLERHIGDLICIPHDSRVDDVVAGTAQPERVHSIAPLPTAAAHRLAGMRTVVVQNSMTAMPEHDGRDEHDVWLHARRASDRHAREQRMLLWAAASAADATQAAPTATRVTAARAPCVPCPCGCSDDAVATGNMSVRARRRTDTNTEMPVAAPCDRIDISHPPALVLDMRCCVAEDATHRNLHALRGVRCGAWQGMHVNSSILKGMLDLLSSIEVLSVLNSDAVSATSLSTASLECLRVLDVRGCVHVDDSFCSMVATTCTHLEVAMLAGCVRITNAGLAGLSACTRLNTLDISWLPHINEDGLIPLASRCTLSRLCMDGLGRGEDAHAPGKCAPIAAVTSRIDSKWQAYDPDQSCGGGLVGRPLMQAIVMERPVELLVPLREVSLAACVGVTDDTLASLARSAGDSLLSLDVTHCWSVTRVGLQAVWQHCTSLAHFAAAHCVSVCSPVWDGQSGALIDTSLRFLDITGCNGIDAADTACLLRRMQHLQELHVAFGPALRDSFDVALPSLQTLSCAGCTATGDSLVTWLQHATRLLHLDISACTSLRDVHLQHIVDTHPMLQEISVSACPSISNDGVCMAATRLPNLTTLRAALHHSRAGITARTGEGASAWRALDLLCTIGAACSSLVHIDLTGRVFRSPDSSAAIVALFPKDVFGSLFPRLRRLDIGSSGPWSEAGLRTLAPHLSNLVHADTSNILGLSAKQAHAALLQHDAHARGGYDGACVNMHIRFTHEQHALSRITKLLRHALYRARVPAWSLQRRLFLRRRAREQRAARCVQRAMIAHGHERAMQRIAARGVIVAFFRRGIRLLRVRRCVLRACAAYKAAHIKQLGACAVVEASRRVFARQAFRRWLLRTMEMRHQVLQPDLSSALEIRLPGVRPRVAFADAASLGSPQPRVTGLVRGSAIAFGIDDLHDRMIDLELDEIVTTCAVMLAEVQAERPEGSVATQLHVIFNQLPTDVNALLHARYVATSDYRGIALACNYVPALVGLRTRRLLYGPSSGHSLVKTILQADSLDLHLVLSRQRIASIRDGREGIQQLPFVDFAVFRAPQPYEAMIRVERDFRMLKVARMHMMRQDIHARIRTARPHMQQLVANLHRAETGGGATEHTLSLLQRDVHSLAADVAVMQESLRLLETHMPVALHELRQVTAEWARVQRRRYFWQHTIALAACCDARTLELTRGGNARVRAADGRLPLCVTRGNGYALSPELVQALSAVTTREHVPLLLDLSSKPTPPLAPAGLSSALLQLDTDSSAQRDLTTRAGPHDSDVASGALHRGATLARQWPLHVARRALRGGNVLQLQDDLTKSLQRLRIPLDEMKRFLAPTVLGGHVKRELLVQIPAFHVERARLRDAHGHLIREVHRRLNIVSSRRIQRAFRRWHTETRFGTGDGSVLLMSSSYSVHLSEGLGSVDSHERLEACIRIQSALRGVAARFRIAQLRRARFVHDAAQYTKELQACVRAKDAAERARAMPVVTAAVTSLSKELLWWQWLLAHSRARDDPRAAAQVSTVKEWLVHLRSSAGLLIVGEENGCELDLPAEMDGSPSQLMRNATVSTATIGNAPERASLSDGIRAAARELEAALLRGAPRHESNPSTAPHRSGISNRLRATLSAMSMLALGEVAGVRTQSSTASSPGITSTATAAVGGETAQVVLPALVAQHFACFASSSPEPVSTVVPAVAMAPASGPSRTAATAGSRTLTGVQASLESASMNVSGTTVHAALVHAAAESSPDTPIFPGQPLAVLQASIQSWQQSLLQRNIAFTADVGRHVEQVAHCALAETLHVILNDVSETELARRSAVDARMRSLSAQAARISEFKTQQNTLLTDPSTWWTQRRVHYLSKLHAEMMRTTQLPQEQRANTSALMAAAARECEGASAILRERGLIQDERAAQLLEQLRHARDTLEYIAAERVQLRAFLERLSEPLAATKAQKRISTLRSVLTSNNMKRVSSFFMAPKESPAPHLDGTPTEAGFVPTEAVPSAYKPTSGYDWQRSDEWLMRRTRMGRVMYVHSPTGTTVTKEPTAPPPGYLPDDDAPTARGVLPPAVSSFSADNGDVDAAVVAALPPSSRLASKPRAKASLPPPLMLDVAAVYASGVELPMSSKASRPSGGLPPLAPSAATSQRARTRTEAAPAISVMTQNPSHASGTLGDAGTTDRVESSDSTALAQLLAPPSEAGPMARHPSINTLATHGDSIADASVLSAQRSVVKAHLRWLSTEETLIKHASARMECFLAFMGRFRVEHAQRVITAVTAVEDAVKELRAADVRQRRVHAEFMQLVLERHTHEYIAGLQAEAEASSPEEQAERAAVMDVASLHGITRPERPEGHLVTTSMQFLPIHETEWRAVVEEPDMRRAYAAAMQRARDTATTGATDDDTSMFLSQARSGALDAGLVATTLDVDGWLRVRPRRALTASISETERRALHSACTQRDSIRDELRALSSHAAWFSTRRLTPAEPERLTADARTRVQFVQGGVIVNPYQWWIPPYIPPRAHAHAGNMCAYSTTGDGEDVGNAGFWYDTSDVGSSTRVGIFGIVIDFGVCAPMPSSARRSSAIPDPAADARAVETLRGDVRKLRKHARKAGAGTADDLGNAVRVPAPVAAGDDGPSTSPYSRWQYAYERTFRFTESATSTSPRAPVALRRLNALLPVVNFALLGGQDEETRLRRQALELGSPVHALLPSRGFGSGSTYAGSAELYSANLAIQEVRLRELTVECIRVRQDVERRIADAVRDIVDLCATAGEIPYPAPVRAAVDASIAATDAAARRQLARSRFTSAAVQRARARRRKGTTTSRTVSESLTSTSSKGHAASTDDSSEGDMSSLHSDGEWERTATEANYQYDTGSDEDSDAGSSGSGQSRGSRRRGSEASSRASTRSSTGSNADDCDTPSDASSMHSGSSGRLNRTTSRSVTRSGGSVLSALSRARAAAAASSASGPAATQEDARLTSDFKSEGFKGMVAPDGSIMEWAGNGTQFFADKWHARYALKPWLVDVALSAVLTGKTPAQARAAMPELLLEGAAALLKAFRSDDSSLPATGLEVAQAKLLARREELAAKSKREREERERRAKEKERELRERAQHSVLARTERLLRRMGAKIKAFAAKQRKITMRQRLQAARAMAVNARAGASQMGVAASRLMRNLYYTAQEAVANYELRRNRQLKKTMALVRRTQLQALDLPRGIDAITFTQGHRHAVGFARAQRERFDDDKSFFLQVPGDVGVVDNPVYMWYRETNDVREMIADIAWAPQKEDDPEARILLDQGYTPIDMQGLVATNVPYVIKGSGRPITALRVSWNPEDDIMHDGDKFTRAHGECVSEYMKPSLRLWKQTGELHGRPPSNYREATRQAEVAMLEGLLPSLQQKLQAMGATSGSSRVADGVRSQIESVKRELERRKKRLIRDTDDALEEIAIAFLGLKSDETERLRVIFDSVLTKGREHVMIGDFFKRFNITRSPVYDCIFVYLDTSFKERITFGAFLRALSSFCMLGAEQVFSWLFALVSTGAIARAEKADIYQRRDYVPGASSADSGTWPDAQKWSDVTVSGVEGFITVSAFANLVKHVQPPISIAKALVVRAIARATSVSERLQSGASTAASTALMNMETFSAVASEFPGLLAPVFMMQSHLRSAIMGEDWWATKRQLFADARGVLRAQFDRAARLALLQREADANNVSTRTNSRGDDSSRRRGSAASATSLGSRVGTLAEGTTMAASGTRTTSAAYGVAPDA